jgi:large subunit ribosomal protein L30
MTAKTQKGPMLSVRQVRSGIGFNREQRATLKALGLGKIGRVRALPDNPAVRGMVQHVRHLVVAEPAGQAEDRREGE